MKKQKNKYGKPLPDTSTETNRMIYYDQLHFIPVENKDERWAAEVLYFNVKNSSPFQDAAVLYEKRRRDKNEINEAQYKAMVDPINKKAEYFSSDWKGNPIFNHLNNIIDAKIEKIPNTLEVKATDEFSKSNQQKENDRILGQRQFREFINRMNAKIGFPPLRENEDPFKYVEKIQKSAEQGGGAPKDMPIGLIDSLKSAIQDNEDLALFNEYIWKDGVEIACELGIHHYLFVVNKFMEYSEDILSDIRLVNKCCLRWFTSETTGTPVIKYMSPETVQLSPFKKTDLSDVIHWYFEEDVTFGDFVREVGAGLSKDQLKAVFERGKQNRTMVDYDKMSPMARNSTMIRIGYMEFESQDLEVYSNFVSRGNEKFKRESSDWYPSQKEVKNLGAERIEKNYNVWRSFYYIPQSVTMTTQGTADFTEQAKYIFKLKKVQDQQRYGDDYRYAKNSLMGIYSKKMSFFDVMDAYMPQIHLLWQKVKNDFAQAIPSGVVWAKSFLIGAMKAADEKDKKPAELMSDMMSKIMQTGTAISDVTGQDGLPVPGAVPFTPMQSNYIKDAADKMTAMMLLYQQMTRALGISDTAEGVDPKPRTSVQGIQTAVQAGSNSTFFIEKYFGRVVIQGGERIMNYLYDIVDDKSSTRLKEFQDIVGQANGMAMESIQDIPKHKLGLSVQTSMSDEMRQRVDAVANQMAGAGLLDPDIALFIASIENVKQATAILRLKAKQKARELQQQQAQQQQAIADQANQNSQFEMQKIQAMWQLQEHMRLAMKQADAQIAQLEGQAKQQGQLEIKDKINENKIQEQVAKKQIEQGQPV